jgi:hypothetical protein
MASPFCFHNFYSFHFCIIDCALQYNVLNQHPSFPGFIGPADASDADQTRGPQRIAPVRAHQADFHKGHILGQRFLRPHEDCLHQIAGILIMPSFSIPRLSSVKKRYCGVNKDTGCNHRLMLSKPVSWLKILLIDARYETSIYGFWPAFMNFELSLHSN